MTDRHWLYTLHYPECTSQNPATFRNAGSKIYSSFQKPLTSRNWLLK